MKKTIIFLICFTTICSSLAACGNLDNNGNKQSVEAQVQTNVKNESSISNAVTTIDTITTTLPNTTITQQSSFTTTTVSINVSSKNKYSPKYRQNRKNMI